VVAAVNSSRGGFLKGEGGRERCNNEGRRSKVKEEKGNGKEDVKEDRASERVKTVHINES
jgi:hypothetical protein